MGTSKGICKIVQGSLICKNPIQEISQMPTSNQIEINKLWHIHKMEYFTAMRKNKLLLSCNSLDESHKKDVS